MTLALLDTLIYLHGQHNIAHRDLKPQNILLDEENNPKICDLGMAKFIGKGDQTVFRREEGGGSSGYMPPEVITIKVGQHYEPKYWDVFSMAMIIYYMWTGKHPLEEEFRTNFCIDDEISKGTRPFLPMSMPIAIKDIVRQMWEQDYTKRPTIEEVSIKFNKLYEMDESSETNHIPLNSLTDDFL